MTNEILMMSAAADLCESSLANGIGLPCQKGLPHILAKKTYKRKRQKCFTVFCLSEQKDSRTRNSYKKGKPASCILSLLNFHELHQELMAQSFITFFLSQLKFDTANCINKEYGKLIN